MGRRMTDPGYYIHFLDPLERVLGLEFNELS